MSGQSLSPFLTTGLRLSGKVKGCGNSCSLKLKPPSAPVQGTLSKVFPLLSIYPGHRGTLEVRSRREEEADRKAD